MKTLRIIVMDDQTRIVDVHEIDDPINKSGHPKKIIGQIITNIKENEHATVTYIKE